MSVLPAEIYGQLQSKIENSRKTVSISISISDNSLKNGPIFTNNDKENAHLSKSDKNVPPEISDKVPKCQLISKCLFGVIVWTKRLTKLFPGFLP